MLGTPHDRQLVPGQPDHPQLEPGPLHLLEHVDPSKLRRLWGRPGPMDRSLVAELPPCSPGKTPVLGCSLLVVGIQGLVMLASGCVTSQDGRHGQRGGLPCHVPLWALGECPRPHCLETGGGECPFFRPAVALCRLLKCPSRLSAPEEMCCVNRMAASGTGAEALVTGASPGGEEGAHLPLYKCCCPPSTLSWRQRSTWAPCG